jgi:hypothetical protein
VAATGEDGVRLAAETFPVALTGKVEVAQAALTIKKKLVIQYPDQLDKPLVLDHNSQLKVRCSDWRHRAPTCTQGIQPSWHALASPRLCTLLLSFWRSCYAL